MARIKSGTLTFRNPDQKVIWECELLGQLSDGQWENAMPYDHWEPWSNAEVTVDPDDVGRDFDVKKDGYGFTRKDFVDCDFSGNGTYSLGDRIMGYVRVARTFGYDKDVRAIADYGDRSDGYISEYVTAETRAIIVNERERIAAVIGDESIYNRTQMMADLRDISAIIKVIKGDDADQLVERHGVKSWIPNIHVASCSKVRNIVSYNKSLVTEESVVNRLGRRYGVSLDDCIPKTRRLELGARANALRASEAQVTARRNLLVDAAVAEVAANRMREQVGVLIGEEADQYAAMVKQITDGDFTPHSVRDLREVAIIRNRSVA